MFFVKISISTQYEKAMFCNFPHITNGLVRIFVSKNERLRVLKTQNSYIIISVKNAVLPVKTGLH